MNQTKNRNTIANSIFEIGSVTSFSVTLMQVIPPEMDKQEKNIQIKLIFLELNFELLSLNQSN
jgi:hypothetical protein